ncbi:hypothetical protein ABT336_03640 [Micromonospora sp. NPDC000207]|uniref:hypothetical protein n=1 Tax=Micromonospora sp. NPDC000207 TaxID=3154246 RepID=UPI00332A73B9
MSNHLNTSDAVDPTARNRRKKWLATGIAGLTGVVSLGLVAATNAGAVTRVDDLGGQQSQRDDSARGEGQNGREGDGDQVLNVTNVPCDVNELFAAINLANQHLGGTLKLARDCTYELRNGTATTGPSTGSNALPPITTDITILGEHSSLERAFDLPSAAPALFRIFQVGPGGNLRLSDLTLRNGLVTGGNDGGAILVQAGGRAELNGVKLTQNNAAGGGAVGGAIANLGTTVLKDSSLTLNNAGGSGGAVSNTGTLTVEKTYFEANKTSSIAPNGGGAVASTGGTVQVRESTFVGNQTAGSGGGLQLTAGSGSVTDTTFRLNIATFNGGGIGNTGADLQLRNVKFVQNTAILSGGGLFTSPGTTTTVLPGEPTLPTDQVQQSENGSSEAGGNRSESGKGEDGKGKGEDGKSESGKGDERKGEDGKGSQRESGKGSTAEKSGGKGAGEGGERRGDQKGERGDQKKDERGGDQKKDERGGDQKKDEEGKKQEESQGIEVAGSAIEQRIEEHRGTTFFGNVAGLLGGGVTNNGVLTLADTAILRNQATQTGGGIHNGVTGTVVIQRSIITENQAGAEGGGNFNAGPTGSVTVDIRSRVFKNNPANCAPLGNIANCQG